MDSKHPKKSFCSSALGHPLEKALGIPVLCLGHWNTKALPLAPVQTLECGTSLLSPCRYHASVAYSAFKI